MLLTRIELPLPFELRSVNVHALPYEDGYLLVDSGLGTQESFEALSAGLRNAGIDWDQIRVVLLTHMHPDHMGQTRRVLELSKAKLWIHEADLDFLGIFAAPDRRTEWLHHALSLAGVPLATQEKMDAGFAEMRKNLYPLTPDRLLRGGEAVQTGAGPMHVLWTPGHAPGHVSLHLPATRTLLSGDLMLPMITPNISWMPDSDPLSDYFASLERMRGIELAEIYPSHGEPFQDHNAWIDTTRAHHAERIASLEAAVKQRPRTAHQLVSEIWPRRLAAVHQHFAVMEVMSHLEHMHREHALTRDTQPNGIVWGT